MCYRPLKIFNPSRNLTTRDKIWLEVPCGKCYECRKRQRNDWFVRAFFEYMYTRDVKHGQVFFVTLTYEQAQLPLFHDWVDDTTRPCFSKLNVQKFLKRLRMALIRKFRIPKDQQKEILKYFICSELGMQTDRPHHHGLLYINYPLSRLDIEAVKTLIEAHWIHGFVNFGRRTSNIPIPGVISSAKGIFYVCKYIGKDLYLNYENTVKAAQPFHLQSQGFGYYMIDYYGLKSGNFEALQFLIDGTFVIPSEGRISKEQYTYAIPQYINRKVLYDYESEYLYTSQFDENTGEVRKRQHYKVTYTLNALGLEVKKYQSIHSIEFQQQEFDRILGSIRNVINDDKSLSILTSRVPVFNPPYSFTCVDEYADFIKENYFDCTDRDRLNLALYTSLFKDRIVVPTFDNNYFDDESTHSLQSALLYLDELYQHDINSLIAAQPIDKLGLVYDSLHHSDFIKSSLASHTYAHQLNPQKYSIYETLIAIQNCLLYVIGLRNEEQKAQEQYLYDCAKLKKSNYSLQPI